MRTARPCLSCGQLQSEGPRHLRCQAEYESPQRQVYSSPQWQRLRAAAIAQHVRRHGWLCPGYGRGPHPSQDLTLDHPVALARGGEPYPRQPQVLCRSCNGRKAATPAQESAP